MHVSSIMCFPDTVLGTVQDSVHLPVFTVSRNHYDISAVVDSHLSEIELKYLAVGAIIESELMSHRSGQTLGLAIENSVIIDVMSGTEAHGYDTATNIEVYVKCICSECASGKQRCYSDCCAESEESCCFHNFKFLKV